VRRYRCRALRRAGGSTGHETVRFEASAMANAGQGAPVAVPAKLPPRSSAQISTAALPNNQQARLDQPAGSLAVGCRCSGFRAPGFVGEHGSLHRWIRAARCQRLVHQVSCGASTTILIATLRIASNVVGLTDSLASFPQHSCLNTSFCAFCQSGRWRRQAYESVQPAGLTEA
jgi:hypothetical protein